MSSFNIEIERNGKIYKGRAEVKRDILTVHGFGIGSKNARISASNEALAEIILRELVEDHENKYK